MKLFKVIKKVESKEIGKDGKPLVKSYTNFYLKFYIGENLVSVPIQPVNFGEYSNRKNYNLLSLLAVTEDDEPF